MHRGLLGSLAAICWIAVLIPAMAASAAPQQSANVLLKDPLSKPSSAMPGAVVNANGYIGSYRKGKYQIQNTGVHTQNYAPTFDATGAQLSAVSAEVDISLATSKTRAGLNCREGDTIDTRYVFLIAGNGHWLVGKSLAPNNTVVKSGSLKIRPNQTFHLRIECSGPEQPGPTGTVTETFFINGKKVASGTDATSALPVSLPASIGMEVESLGAASFSNITVAELPAVKSGRSLPPPPAWRCTPATGRLPRACGSPSYSN